MNLQLLDGSSWAAVPAGGTTPLKIMSIDTGAGKVTFPGGVEIALVAEDSLTALCEDSCSFADDGQCDEPGVVSLESTVWSISYAWRQDVVVVLISLFDARPIVPRFVYALTHAGDVRVVMLCFLVCGCTCQYASRILHSCACHESAVRM